MRFSLRLPMLVMALALAAGCAVHPFTEQKLGDTISGDSLVQLPSSKVDILFVVDNSGSMADKQNVLRQSSSTFIDALTASNVNYHIGIVTTDLYASSDSGRLRMTGRGPAFMAAPSPSDPSAAQARAQIVQAFNDTVASLGTSGSSAEAGLGTVVAALAPTDAAVQARNAGFLRPEADLAVIIISDEDDCTPTAQGAATASRWAETGTECYQAADAASLETPGNMVSQFIALKGSVSRVRVALVSGGERASDGTFTARACRTGSDGTPDTQCGCWYYSASDLFCSPSLDPGAQVCTSTATCGADSCNSATGTCDAARCLTTAPLRYKSFMDTLAAQRQNSGAPSGIFVDSICQNDYRNTLLQVAQDVVLPSCFALRPSIDQNQLVLQVAHQRTDGSYTETLTLQRYMASGALPGTCTRCGDCPNSAWQSAANNQICLACGTQSQPGDMFTVSTAPETR